MGLLGSLKTFHRNLFVIMSCFTFIEAVKAINRAIFRRTERNFRLFTAFNAFQGLVFKHSSVTPFSFVPHRNNLLLTVPLFPNWRTRKNKWENETKRNNKLSRPWDILKWSIPKKENLSMLICNIIAYNFSKIHFLNHFSTGCCYLCWYNCNIIHNIFVTKVCDKEKKYVFCISAAILRIKSEF